jgi:predicted RNase H-like HicB family nuclease
LSAGKEVRDHLSRPYARVVVPDPSGGFAARILEFPGCFAEGDTLGQAYENLESAAAAWIEASLESDQPIPPPAEEQTYSGRLLLRMPKSLHRQAAEVAGRDGTSLNQFVVTAVAARVGAVVERGTAGRRPLKKAR